MKINGENVPPIFIDLESFIETLPGGK